MTLENATKRTYTKRSKEERLKRLRQRLATLKQAHEIRAKLIDKLEGKMSQLQTTATATAQEPTS